MLEVGCPEPAAVVARMLSARSRVASARHLSEVLAIRGLLAAPIVFQPSVSVAA
ncbi:hypothetical protein AMYX_29480 [Anaeromyxobacter diazotrophicus]|uniref:Uncharacterized protein n=1 Tax=Anaeromyxobacter diazotrophicus TaxID=2590199 RepID=A0A7I9VQF6_9BACT|nr:hypothetical protein AMYX_29480 [Anaeromyxobacter diazotrophicus]